MPELNTFACDVCAAQKREVNRWWVLYVLDGELKVREWDIACELLWKKLGELELPRAVACGEEHAQQLFARWLVSGSFDAPSQRPISPPSSVPTREEGSDE